MASTLLNPACDTCYDCCPQCDDYDEPWYVWLEKFVNYSEVFDSFVFFDSFPWQGYAQHYWSSNLHSVLNNLLAEIAFSSGIWGVGGTYKTYDASDAEYSFGPSVEATGTVYIKHLFPPGSWQPIGIRFHDFKFHSIAIRNHCGSETRNGTGVIAFKMSQVTGYYYSLPDNTQNQEFYIEALSLNNINNLQSCEHLPLECDATNHLYSVNGGLNVYANYAGTSMYYYNVYLPLVQSLVSSSQIKYSGQMYLGTTAP